MESEGNYWNILICSFRLPPAPDVRPLWRNQIDTWKLAFGASHHPSTLWFWSQVAWSRPFLIFCLSVLFRSLKDPRHLLQESTVCDCTLLLRFWGVLALFYKTRKRKELNYFWSLINTKQLTEEINCTYNYIGLPKYLNKRKFLNKKKFSGWVGGRTVLRKFNLPLLKYKEDRQSFFMRRNIQRTQVLWSSIF